MTDTEKLALCKAILDDAFVCGVGSAEGAASTMCAILTVIEFEEDDK